MGKRGVGGLALVLVGGMMARSWEYPELPAAAGSPPYPVPASADPRGYPDAEGFRTRADAVVQTLAAEELDKWRRGYFAGGDPGKYLPGAAMAKLLVDPADAEVRRYQNDDRSAREQYHFAAVNWARFYPLFGEAVLTPETRSRLADSVRGYNYLETGGTENHRTMWMTTANVLPGWLGVGTNHRSLEATQAEAKRQLRDYVKGLFLAGSGEWDSSTYLMFTVHGLMNIYDFSTDPESRLLAQAGLDLLVAGYALKYTDGVFCGPNQRGQARRPHETIADQTGFVWWGSGAAGGDTPREYRYAMHAITSAWRPGRVLTSLARRKVAGLPAEQRDSKANYWYGQKLDPRPGSYHESVWIAPQLTMGSLWDGHASQLTRFLVVVASPAGGVAFTGGHPRQSDHTQAKTGLGFRDGIGRYVQSAQVGDTYLCMAKVPEDDEADYAFFAYPPECPPERQGEWQVFHAGNASVAVHPLAGGSEMGTNPPNKKGVCEPILRYPGRQTGFFVVVGDATLPAALPQRVPDTSRFASEWTVAWRTGDGRSVEAAFDPAPEGDLQGNRPARTLVDGKPVTLKDWPIYEGPFVRQVPGRLEVSDGREGFAIDFTGDLPVYSGK